MLRKVRLQNIRQAVARLGFRALRFFPRDQTVRRSGGWRGRGLRVLSGGV